MVPSDLDPIGVFLVSSGTRGDRLLFRYPFELPVATHSLPERELHLFACCSIALCLIIE